MAERNKRTIIGIDLGNYNTYVSFIQDLDFSQSRLGGYVQDLVPAQFKDGIPSIFLYSPELERRQKMPLVGMAASRAPARYRHQQVRYLKEHLDEELLINGKKVVIDGTTYDYNRAIQSLVKYVVQQANDTLEKNYGYKTNYVSLAYPANFSSAKRNHLINLVNGITLDDGQKLKVFGTISEPAAATLDYLADHPDKMKDSQTALVYDLGGGTFDIAQITSYPKGRKNAHGDLSYYYIEKEGGIQNIGGKYYTDVIYNMLLKELAKENVKPQNPNDEAELMSKAEETKHELTDEPSYNCEIRLGSDYYDVLIKRSDFEKQAKHLVDPTIEMVKQFINDENISKPDIILMTGGASQMKMIQKRLEQELPDYKGKIIFHRPTLAISYGAARYGCAESDTDLLPGQKTVTKILTYTIGSRLFRGSTDVEYTEVYLEEGTVLPCTSRWIRSSTRVDNQTVVVKKIVEANKHHPDVDRPYDDFGEIMQLTVEFGKAVPADTPLETRMMIDQEGILHVESRPVDQPDKLYKNHIKLMNIQSS